MKAIHKVEQNICINDLEYFIDKYEQDNWEVAAMTYYEYHYTIIFKKYISE